MSTDAADRGIYCAGLGFHQIIHLINQPMNFGGINRALITMRLVGEISMLVRGTCHQTGLNLVLG